jgi:hypothetical protein
VHVDVLFDVRISGYEICTTRHLKVSMNVKLTAAHDQNCPNANERPSILNEVYVGCLKGGRSWRGGGRTKWEEG